jgi:hypothetical protein
MRFKGLNVYIIFYIFYKIINKYLFNYPSTTFYDPVHEYVLVYPILCSSTCSTAFTEIAAFIPSTRKSINKWCSNSHIQIYMTVVDLFFFPSK